ncbi:MAG: prepilin-type N-terminal cleavage/methylation domain-containing protein [Deltaproteobacteria bacterium]|nr:prepilin-type N-terminal cleavage/methylation domain-containing protein [Deltaproteobacteria bacterium]
MQNQKGFSLIELMIVVVVLGILASVAVPNYQRFQARSRQSSAKTLLSGYLTSQKATYAEYAYYAGNFVGAGFIPEGSLGFRLTAADNPDVLGGPTTNPVDLFPGCDATSVVPNAANCSALYDSRWVESTYAQIAPVGCVAAAAGVMGAPGSFTTCASGLLGNGTADTWSITQLGLVTNTNNGAP